VRGPERAAVSLVIDDDGLDPDLGEREPRLVWPVRDFAHSWFGSA
jgi:hypothetical protein